MIGKLGWLTTKALQQVHAQQKNIEFFNEIVHQQEAKTFKSTSSFLSEKVDKLHFVKRGSFLSERGEKLREVLELLPRTPIQEQEEEESPQKKLIQVSPPSGVIHLSKMSLSEDEDGTQAQTTPEVADDDTRDKQ